MNKRYRAGTGNPCTLEHAVKCAISSKMDGTPVIVDMLTMLSLWAANDEPKHRELCQLLGVRLLDFHERAYQLGAYKVYGREIVDVIIHEQHSTPASVRIKNARNPQSILVERKGCDEGCFLEACKDFKEFWMSKNSGKPFAERTYPTGVGEVDGNHITSVRRDDDDRGVAAVSITVADKVVKFDCGSTTGWEIYRDWTRR